MAWLLMSLWSNPRLRAQIREQQSMVGDFAFSPLTHASKFEPTSHMIKNDHRFFEFFSIAAVPRLGANEKGPKA
jgi:hypothetical protein